MKTYCQMLKDAAVPPSMQRIKILEYLNQHDNHPTADMIFQALREQLPTLSKTTVYNTLKILVEHGLVSELRIFENEIRYEFNPAPHTHFKCEKCGRILDLPMKPHLLEENKIEGHLITCHQVMLKGICRDCLSGGAHA